MQETDEAHGESRELDGTGTGSDDEPATNGDATAVDAEDETTDGETAT